MTKLVAPGRRWVFRAMWGLAAVLTVLPASGRKAIAEPLSLDQCIDVAIKNNPGLAQSGWQLEGARAARLSAANSFLPSVSYSFSQNRSRAWGTYAVDAYVDPISGEVVRSRTGYRYGTDYNNRLSLSQEVVNLPAWYRYSAVGADLNSAKEGFRGSRGDLVLMVRTQYLSLLGSILIHENAKEALTVSEDQLRRSQALFDVGSVARSDVLQARVTRANAVRDEISARNAVDQARAALAITLGMNVQDALEIRQDLEPPVALDADETSLIREAIDARPEARQARAATHAAELRYRSAWWGHFPVVSLGADWTKGANKLGDALDLGDLDTGSSMGFGLSLSWPLFDGMVTYGNVRGSKADLYAAQERERQEKLNAALGVREAQIAIRNAREGMNAAQEAVALAEENLKLQEALYQNGAGTILELNNAQVERTRAKNSLVEATISLHLANAQLDRALGR
jgi:outer membrane protein